MPCTWKAGSGLFYFTGINWGRGERMMAAVIPAQGEVAYVCPAFEEARLREMILFGDDVRAWRKTKAPTSESPRYFVTEVWRAARSG